MSGAIIQQLRINGKFKTVFILFLNLSNVILNYLIPILFKSQGGLYFKCYHGRRALYIRVILTKDTVDSFLFFLYFPQLLYINIDMGMAIQKLQSDNEAILQWLFCWAMKLNREGQILALQFPPFWWLYCIRLRSESLRL